jgi:hypothetical protein
MGSIIDLFRSSQIPVIYTNLYNRLANGFSTSEGEEVIKAVIRSNVVAIFSKSYMTGLIEFLSDPFQMSSSSGKQTLERVASST